MCSLHLYYLHIIICLECIIIIYFLYFHLFKFFIFRRRRRGLGVIRCVIRLLDNIIWNNDNVVIGAHHVVRRLVG